MIKSIWRKLKAGDVIENVSSRTRYVLIGRHGRSGWIGIRHVVATDCDQWRRVTEREREKI